MKSSALLITAIYLATMPTYSIAQTATNVRREQPRAFVEPLDLMNPRSETENCSGAKPIVSGRTVTLGLKITYSDHTIYNPDTGDNDSVHLRTYDDCLVGPTVTLHPGDRFLLNVENDIQGANPFCPATLTDHNDPNCFNSGNIHTHGLHVSPAGNSDNVLLSIPPGTSFPYQYDLLDNHPAGTFWYHSHRHGSTALSVSSGMVGALIIKGNRRVQDKTKPGDIADIDTILNDKPHKPMKERLFVLEQIAYGCFANGDFSGSNAPEQVNGVWVCKPGEQGVVENYKTQFGFEPVPAGNPNVPPGVGAASVWPVSGRYTEINGIVQPTLTLEKSGQIERWRIVDGGVRDTINFEITKTKPGATDFKSNTSGAFVVPKNTKVSEVCDTSQVISQYEIAVDGLTRREIHAKQQNILQPGYRSDLLMVFPAPGDYCVLDTLLSPNASISGAAHHHLQSADNNLLATVRVRSGPTITQNLQTYIEQQILAANPDLPTAVAQRIKNGDISDYSPHRDLNTAQVQGQPFADFSFVLFNTPGGRPNTTPGTIPASPAPQNAVLLGQAAIADTLAAAQAKVANTAATIPTLPNDATYEPDTVNYTAPLGSTDQWTITSSNAAHVFHIHVNPFELMDIRDPKGNSIFQNGTCTELSLPSPDPEYCDVFDSGGQKHGVFRDTIFIKPGYQIVMRTKYETYIGEYVMHCHILDHEDQGMMQNIVICPPGGPCPATGPTGSITAHMMHH